MIGGDALGPALQKLLGEESQCVAAGTDRAVVKMDPPETSLDGLKQKHIWTFYGQKRCVFVTRTVGSTRGWSSGFPRMTSASCGSIDTGEGAAALSAGSFKSAAWLC